MKAVKQAQAMSQTITVDFLYLDLNICTRCQDSEINLEESLQTLIDILDNIGHKIKLNKIYIETEAQAIKHQFISSPTIRIDGQDIQMTVTESYCSTCSSLTNDASIHCRTWQFNGKEYSAPPPALIIDAILSRIYSTNTAKEKNIVEKKYQLPDNLKEYFAKKDQLCANVNSPTKTNNAKDSCCRPHGCC